MMSFAIAGIYVLWKGCITLVNEIYLLIKGFLNQTKKDSVSAFSAQAAFFLILSVVPFFSLLLTLVQFLPVNKAEILTAVVDIMPAAFEPVVSTIIDELFNQSTGAVISISALIALWSAGKGVMAIIRGLNSVYHVTEKRNYFVLRIVSAIYTVLFVFALVLSLLLLVFSNSIYKFLKKQIPVIAEFTNVFFNHKIILSLGILIIIFIFIYRLVQDTHSDSALFVVPGALISSVSWVVFSYAFSLYIDKFSNFSYTYGSLSTIVIAMLWIYICMYILFIGAEINQYFRLHFKMAYKYFRKRKKRIKQSIQK